MINSAQKDRVIAVLKKYGFVEQRMTKELFIIPDGRKISADLRGENPIIGVEIAGMIHAAGHGINAVQDIQNEVAAAMKFKSSASEQKGSNPASGGISKAPVMKGAIPSESKLGAGDTKNSEVKYEGNNNNSHSDNKNNITGGPGDREKGGQKPLLKNVTAMCEGCSKKMQGSIVEFQEIEAKYNGIYCPDCVTTPTLKEPFAKAGNLKAGKIAGLGTQKQEAIKKGTTTATCKGCGCLIAATIDEFTKVDEKFGGIYCMDCQKKQPIKDNHEVAGNVPATPAKPEAKTLKIPMCCDCGIEVSHKEALDCITNEEKVRCEQCKGKHDEAKHQEAQKGKDEATQERKARPEVPEVKEKIMDEKLPAKQEQVKSPAKMSDQERDDMIEIAKAKRFLEGQGGSYSVSGKNRPDSAMVQKVANASDISSEILFAEQTKDYAHVVVRGHRGNNYVDAVVHHDFETEFQLQTMEIIKKNPQILDHYEELIPVIKEGATVTIGFGDKQTTVDAKYYLIHALLTFKTFSLRDATTKAMQIVQSKLLNQDSRTKEEVASEQKERDLVEEKRSQKR